MWRWEQAFNGILFPRPMKWGSFGRFTILAGKNFQQLAPLSSFAASIGKSESRNPFMFAV
jgi:hypothetical protein